MSMPLTRPVSDFDRLNPFVPSALTGKKLRCRIQLGMDLQPNRQFPTVMARRVGSALLSFLSFFALGLDFELLSERDAFLLLWWWCGCGG